MASNTPTLLSVENLRIEAARAGVVALEGLSFSLEPGAFLAIVGESGSGKTMASRALMDLLPPGMKRTGGHVLFEGREIQTLPPRTLRELRGGAIGMVFQEPMVSLNPAMTIGAQMIEGLKRHRRVADAEARRLAVQMLERIGLADGERLLRAFPHEFSGGMRQRIMLGSVMLLRPRLLIADEPTTALDTLSQQEVLSLMVELTREVGAAVLLITHNLGLVARYAERVLVLERGRLVEEGEARRVLAAPVHPYTRRLVDSIPRRRAGRARVGAVRVPLISVTDLRVRYPGRNALFRPSAPHTAVDGVSLEVREGETLGLVGGSGSGKTTLGRALLGLIPGAEGVVRFRGEPVSAHDRSARRAFRLANQLIFQDPFSSLDPRQRIGAAVGEPLCLRREVDRAERTRRVAEVLDEVGLSGLASRFPHELSGGQRQRVAIARALVGRPAFVVADEPVSALDMTVQAQVLELLRRLQQAYGFACLFVSHDLCVVQQVADRVVVLDSGRVVEEGLRDDVFDRPTAAYTRALLAATPELGLPGLNSAQG